MSNYPGGGGTRIVFGTGWALGKMGGGGGDTISKYMGEGG